MDYVLIFAILQGVTLLIVLYRKKFSDKRSVSLLAWLIFFTLLILLGRLSYQPIYLKKYWAIISLPDVLLFLFGPLLLLFTQSVLKLPRLSVTARFLHFTPAVVHILVVNTVVALMITGKIAGAEQGKLVLIYQWIEAMGIVSCATYIFLSFRTFSRSHHIYLNNLSSEIVPRFLKGFYVFMFVLIVMWTLSFSAKLIGWYTFMDWRIYNAFWIGISFSVYFLAVLSMMNPAIFSTLFAVQKGEYNPQKKREIEEMAQKLHGKMLTERLYLSSDISLNSLAAEVSLKRNDLSEVINVSFKKNFFDFINAYRVQEFIDVYSQKQSADAKVTFIEVAYEVGFNSKSGFYRAFKKETGESPGTYFQNNVRNPSHETK